MRIVVITDKTTEVELLNQAPQASLVVSWQEEIFEVPEAELIIDFLFDESKERAQQLRQTFKTPIAVNAVGTILADLPEGFIRFNGWPGFLSGPLVETAAKEKDKLIAEQGFLGLGKKPEWVPDIPGFITARVLSMIINEAYFALDEKLSSKQEIDTAMKLGTNYPFGPFEWSERIGLKKILFLLKNLSVTHSRYSPSPLLEKQAIGQWP